MLKRPLLHSIGIVLLSIAVGAGLFLLTITTVSILKSKVLTAADILPASTSILFTQADSTLEKRFAEWFPELQSLPVSDQRRTIAIIRINEKQYAILLFSRRKAGAAVEESAQGWQQRTIGPLTVSASSPDTFRFLDTSQPSLRSAPDFAPLAGRRLPSEPWIYLDTKNLPPSETFPDLLLSAFVLNGATHAAIIPQGNSGSTMELTGSAMPTASAILPIYDSPGTLGSFSSASFPSLWSSLSVALPSQSRTILQTLMLTTTISNLGKNVSFDQHVLPLLRNTASFSLVRNSSGTLALLLRGTGNAAEITPLLDRFHASFRGNLTTARIITRSFDNGRFSQMNLRDDATVIEEGNSTTKEGWTIRSTLSGNEGTGLFSATKGPAFLLSTDETTLLSALRNNEIFVEPMMARGMLSLMALRRDHSSALPSLLSPSSPLLPEGTERMEWSMKKQGKIVVITISRNR
ncbi:MAG: hypothetical protein WCG83_06165 [Candidatus Peregrinibacteria bacterium]